MTIVWHVDDATISHVDKQEIEILINYLKEIYEDPEIGMMKVNRGKVHDYLGMKLDYSEQGAVKIVMRDYVKKMIAEFEYDIGDTERTSPAGENLFKVNERAEKLNNKKKQTVHTMAAKGLFYAKGQDLIYNQ